MSTTAQEKPVEKKRTLWQTLTEVEVNPVNLKCRTLPILTLNNPYSRAFHLSWLGFFVAFLSWFAFPPLIPEAIKTDLKLTPAQIGNSNIVALCATLIVRWVVGPLVDRYGPRKVMATLLIIGAVPSGLAGTAKGINGLFAVRFFIGILGGTFVPCQAWTTTFFDKNVVGSANALVGGWGNMGGGMTFIIMIALYNKLTETMTPHVAWRAAFAIVPVPILLTVAALTFIFGTDHPAGKWEDRHQILAAKIQEQEGGLEEAIDHSLHPEHRHGHPHPTDEKEKKSEDDSTSSAYNKDKKEKEANDDVAVTTVAIEAAPPIESALDIAVNEPLTLKMAMRVLSSPLTWLPALAYATTFGYELALDANLANILHGLYVNMGQTKAGYITAIYGLLNLVTRPAGGMIGDLVYPRFGVAGKKWCTLGVGFIQGALSLGLGFYIDKGDPSLGVVIAVLVIIAIFNEAGNGFNFSLVPHCNPNSNGVMSGLVGGMGNVGGIIFALIFRLHPRPYGKAFWISGVVAMGVNVLVSWIKVPKK